MTIQASPWTDSDKDILSRVTSWDQYWKGVHAWRNDKLFDDTETNSWKIGYKIAERYPFYYCRIVNETSQGIQ